jgi:hypothetical protein
MILPIFSTAPIAKAPPSARKREAEMRAIPDNRQRIEEYGRSPPFGGIWKRGVGGDFERMDWSIMDPSLNRKIEDLSDA